MGVSEDIGQLVLRVSEEAVSYASPDSPQKDKLHNYFTALDRVLGPVQMYAHDKLTALTSKEEFHTKLPRFYPAFSDMLQEVTKQSEMSTDTYRKITAVFGIGTLVTALYTIATVLTDSYKIQPPPFDTPEKAIGLGVGVTTLLAAGAGIFGGIAKRSGKSEKGLNQSSKSAMSATPVDWFKALEDNHDALRRLSSQYWLYARNGR